MAEINWGGIESFIGYGRLNAPVVFIGIEEGLSRKSTLTNDLKRRSRFKQVEDIKDAHLGICGTEKFWDDDRPKSQRTWRPMCHLMLHQSGIVKIDKNKRLEYQVTELGRSSGFALLTELLPYPHVNTKHWSYKRFKKYNNRADYKSAILQKRIPILAKQLRRYPRELIVCYGKQAWADFKCLISYAFPKIRWKSNKNHKAVVGTVGKTRVLLVHHFSSKEFNTQHQLHKFARIATSA